MKIYICQQRADDPALWRAGARVLEQLPLHHACTEEAPDQVEEVPVLDASPQELHQLPVVDRVEVGRDIALDDPEVLQAFLHVPAGVIDGVHRASIGPEPVGALKEIGLVDGFQGHPNRFLHDPIADRRNAQAAKPSTRLRDEHSADRVRTERSILEGLTEIPKVALQVFVVGPHVDPVASRRFTPGVAGDVVMGEHEPVLATDQAEQIVEPVVRFLFGPETETLLHFADIHRYVPLRVRPATSASAFPTDYRPSLPEVIPRFIATMAAPTPAEGIDGPFILTSFDGPPTFTLADFNGVV